MTNGLPRRGACEDPRLRSSIKRPGAPFQAGHSPEYTRSYYYGEVTVYEENCPGRKPRGPP